MVDEEQIAGHQFLRRSLYLRVGILLIAAGVGGALVGRSLGKSNTNTSQVLRANEVILPSGGLLFKSSEGKLVAKLDSDEVGASLILYNSNEQAGAGMS